jgi:hypothetical protein
MIGVIYAYFWVKNHDIFAGTREEMKDKNRQKLDVLVNYSPKTKHIITAILFIVTALIFPLVVFSDLVEHIKKGNDEK